MSAESRLRQFNRRFNGGFPSWLALRADQLKRLPKWLATHTSPSMVAANQAIAEFALEDGRLATYPSQHALDMLFWKEESETVGPPHEGVALLATG